MKLTLKDFGPIDEFTLDLTKDIQFIYGENSVGKSYAVFVLYAVVKSMKNLMDDYFDNPPEHMVADFDKLVEKAKKNPKVKYSCNSEVFALMKYMLENFFLNRFKAILLTKFDTLTQISNTKNNSSSQIDIYTKKSNFSIKIVEKELVVANIGFRGSVNISYDENEFLFHADKTSNISILENKTFSNKTDFLEEFNFKNIFAGILKIYTIPASRSGIYLAMSSFGPVMAELSRNRSSINGSISLPTLSSDVADFFLDIVNINSVNEIGKENPIVKRIEDNILKGKVGFDDRKKRIIYYPNNSDLSLDLIQTSSMIADVSTITAFLKYVIDIHEFVNENEKCLLIIEEPESHLHPKTQVALMELFAELSKYGIKLIVTSHSDFMMDKLSNMILEGKVDADTVGSYRMVMGENGSYDAGDMKASKDGIPDKNFVEISEKLYEERVDIYDQLNEKNAATEYNKS